VDSPVLPRHRLTALSKCLNSLIISTQSISITLGRRTFLSLIIQQVLGLLCCIYTIIVNVSE